MLQHQHRPRLPCGNATASSPLQLFFEYFSFPAHKPTKNHLLQAISTEMTTKHQALRLTPVGWVGGMIIGWSSSPASECTSSSLSTAIGLAYGLSSSTRMRPAVLLVPLLLTGVEARGGVGVHWGFSSSIVAVSSLYISTAGVAGAFIGSLPFLFCVGGEFGGSVGAGAVGEELAESDPSGLSWSWLDVCSAGGYCAGCGSIGFVAAGCSND
ncbi:hypothetical protein V6N13_133651 [Hibiscus sabdariffa]